MRRSFFFVLILFVIGCSKQVDQPETQKRFDKVDVELSGITFRNDIDDLGKYNPYNSYYIYNGGGVAVGDLDNDGLLDVVLSSNQNGCEVYKNLGGFTFENVTENSGVKYEESWTTGLSMVDLNADGLLDLYVCRSGLADDTTRGNLAFINNGGFTFSETAEQIGLHDKGTSNQAYFFDFDQDDDLDVLILNHPVDFENAYYPNSSIDHKNDSIFSNRFYLNEGGKFKVANTLLGVEVDKGFSLSASVGDINKDGFPDIYIANDFISPDQFFINQAGKGFVDKADSIFDKTPLFSMGSDMADMNNDGNLDLFVADMDPADHFRKKNNKIRLDKTYYDQIDQKLATPQLSRNMFFLGSETGFKEIGLFANVSSTDWSWATLFEDLDNDGYKDLFVTNGTKRDLHEVDYVSLTFGGDMIAAKKRHDAMDLIKNMPISPLSNYCFQNTGKLEFENVSEPWGLGQLINGQAAVIADLDNDGQLDIIINNTDTTAGLYRNVGSKSHHYIQLEFEYNHKNQTGIGTKAELWTGHGYQSKELFTNRGFQSSLPPMIHFGIGNSNKIDSLKITWPNGKTQIHFEPSIEQKHKIMYGPDTQVTGQDDLFATLLQVTALPEIKHYENDFDEIQQNKIIPFLGSRSGPALAMADLNSDGIEDLIVGGANNHFTTIFTQKEDGSFDVAPEMFPESVYREVTAIATIDVDNDGDHDIYLGHGSNEKIDLPDYHQDLIYLNDGNGFFSLSNEQPPVTINSTCIVQLDIDGDGNDDLFIGVGFKPGSYGHSTGCRLLRNNEGGYEDITDDAAPELKSIGCVNDAQLTDVDSDGSMDLIVAGHWDKILRFEVTKDGLRKLDPIYNKTGMWNSIEMVDLNGDGHEDLLAGNRGLNSLFKASEEEPVRLYVEDFDENGSLDPLVTHYLDGTEGTFIDKMEFCEKMPQFNNHFLTNRSFAEADLNSILGEKNLNREVVIVEEMRTIAMLNDGNGNFSEVDLPAEVQMSPVKAICSQDITGNGLPELFLFGNSNTEFYDQGDITANHGIVLTWDEKEGLVTLPVSQTGLNVQGVVNSCVLNESTNGWSVLLGRNDDSVGRISPNH